MHDFYVRATVIDMIVQQIDFERGFDSVLLPMVGYSAICVHVYISVS